MQLEDFNHAMLRLIYAFHLAIFGLAVLIFGLIMVPLGYLAVLGIRIRLIYLHCQAKHSKQSFMMRSTSLIDTDNAKKSMISFVCFLTTGVF